MTFEIPWFAVAAMPLICWLFYLHGKEEGHHEGHRKGYAQAKDEDLSIMNQKGPNQR